MSQNGQQGLVTRQTLTEAELLAIQQLTTICNNYDHLHMHLDLHMLRTRPGIDVNDYLYYMDGALVGYLSLYNWGLEETELHVGIVRPDQRRKGIFRALVEAAKKETASRGIPRLILVCERDAQSAQAFIKAIGASYDFSEHEMELGTFQDRYTYDNCLSFRLATSRDLDTLVAVQSASFNSPEEPVRQRITKLLQEPKCHIYLATFGSSALTCQEPVGMLRLDEGEQRIGIYGFGVLPDYRGRGYGRQMLEEAIRTIRANSQKTIMLDVDTTNTNALGLYQSCGFEIITTYDYYAIELSTPK